MYIIVTPPRQGEVYQHLVVEMKAFIMAVVGAVNTILRQQWEEDRTSFLIIIIINNITIVNTIHMLRQILLREVEVDS